MSHLSTFTETPSHSNVLIQSLIAATLASTSANPQISGCLSAQDLQQSLECLNVRQSSPLHGVTPVGNMVQARISGTESSIWRT